MVSRFKEAMARDVDRVFLNEDEFADVHTVEERQIRCIVDRDLYEKDASGLIGVFSNRIEVYIASKDMSPAPVVGQLFHLDGELYLVSNVSIEGGMLVITLEGNEE